MEQNYNQLFNLNDKIFESNMIYNKKIDSDEILATELDQDFSDVNIKIDKLIQKNVDLTDNVDSNAVCIYDNYIKESSKKNLGSGKISNNPKISENNKGSYILTNFIDSSISNFLESKYVLD